MGRKRTDHVSEMSHAQAAATSKATPRARRQKRADCGSPALASAVPHLQPEVMTQPQTPGTDAADYTTFAAKIRRELLVTCTFEEILLHRAIRYGWELVQRVEPPTLDAILRGPERELQNERGLVRMLHALAKVRFLQSVRPSGTEPAAATVSPTSAVQADRPAIQNQVGMADDRESLSESWRDRLIFEPTVSESSPVVKGTWVTAGQVVTLIVDGWTWADILRSHPELTEADIRACLSYAVEEEAAPV